MKSSLVLGSGFTVLMAVALTGAACSDGGGGGGGRGGMDGSTSGLGGNPTGTGGRGGAVGAGGTVTGAGGAEVDAGVPGCNTPQFTHTSLFGNFDGWTVPTGNPTFELAPMPGVDGGPPTGTLMSQETADGSPSAPSAKLEVPFSDVGQQLLFAQNYTSPVNLAGTTVTAQIKLVSGLIGNPVTSVAQAFLVLKSTSAYTFATGVAVNLDPTAGWTTLTVSADNPSTLPIGHNPCDIREIDVEVNTGMAGTYTRAVILIDTIAITGSGGGGDASMDAPGGS